MCVSVSNNWLKQLKDKSRQDSINCQTINVWREELSPFEIRSDYIMKVYSSYS